MGFMPEAKTPHASRIRRHLRVRKNLRGTPERPRLAVFRSLNHVYAQVIDDAKGHTLAAASDLDAEVRTQTNGKKKREVAEMVGEMVARRAMQAGISQVVFDRGGFKFHGRVKAVADAARKGGLTF